MAEPDSLSTGTVTGSLAPGGAYPEGVTLAELHVGPVSSFLGRSAKVIARVTTVLRGTKYIVHAGTGWHLMPSTGNLSAEPGQDIVFHLPHTDQDGWRDSSGAAFSGWAYQVTVEARSAGKVDTYTKTFQLVAGQAGPIELATIPDGQVGEPVSAPIATVTSILGRTGIVTEDDLRAAGLGESMDDAGIAALMQDPAALTSTALDEQTATRIADPATATGAAFSAAVAERAEAGYKHAMLENELYLRTGSPVVTGGAVPVALTFDDDVKGFRDKILPLLKARGLKATMAVNSRMFSDTTSPVYSYNTGLSWSTVAGLHWNDGVEIANHGATHKAATTREELEREIVTSLAEIKAGIGAGIPVLSWIQPGVTYPDFGFGDRTAAYTDTTAGRLILGSHAVVTGTMGSRSTNRYTRDGRNLIGISGLWIDTPAGLDYAQAEINAVKGTGKGIIVRSHPYKIDSSGGTSLAQLTAFLDALKTEQDAGRVKTLTLSEWMTSTSATVADFHDAGVAGYAHRYIPSFGAEQDGTAITTVPDRNGTRTFTKLTNATGPSTIEIEAGHRFARIDSSTTIARFDTAGQWTGPLTVAFVLRSTSVGVALARFGPYELIRNGAPAWLLADSGKTGTNNVATPATAGWTLIVASLDGANTSWSVNGVEVGAGTVDGTGTPNTNAQLAPTGTLDLREMLVWNRALSASERATVRVAMKARYGDLP